MGGRAANRAAQCAVMLIQVHSRCFFIVISVETELLLHGRSADASVNVLFKLNNKSTWSDISVGGGAWVTRKLRVGWWWSPVIVRVPTYLWVWMKALFFVFRRPVGPRLLPVCEPGLWTCANAVGVRWLSVGKLWELCHSHGHLQSHYSGKRILFIYVFFKTYPNACNWSLK